jgi:lathosterol oxidase
MIQRLFDWFLARSFAEWVAFSLVGNVLIFLASVGLCQWLWRRFQHRPLIRAQQPLSRRDLGLAALAVFLNSVVAVVGFGMWKAGLIRLTHPGLLRTLLDVVLFVLAMDFGMYVSHRIAHVPPLFGLLHAPHHLHQRTNALSLFVLHPAEVLGFGALMLAVLVVLPLSGLAVLLYLTLNVLWGTLGHAGVEPMPRALFRWPLLRQLGTGTFHAQHHDNPSRNFGFYTLLWDRLFGTIDPDYPRWTQTGPPL